MSFSLRQLFFANSRGVTFADGGGITWAFNSNTNTVTASGTGAGATSANPSAAVGPTVVNGSAGTFMRSDAAPPIDLTASYTWTGTHAFNTAAVSMNATPLTSATTRPATGLANFKASTTSAVNNTLTADASLTVTANQTGWYDVEALLLVSEATGTTGGFQFDFTSAATIANNKYTSSGMSNGAAYTNSGRPTTTLSSFAATSISANPDWCLVKGVIQVTVAGTFGIRWAQNATVAGSATSVLVGSYLKLTKIG